MGRKYFFKAPFKRDVYISLRMESKKFAAKDGRFVVATEPLTLKEYYVAFHAEVPFKACVVDRTRLVLPDDLEGVVSMAREVRRGRGRISLRWCTRGDDLEAEEEVEIRGRLQRGMAAIKTPAVSSPDTTVAHVEVLVKGCGEVRVPFRCKDPDDCMWPLSILTTLYELANKYKVLKYRGAESVELAIKLLERGLGRILLYNADVNEVEALLKKEGEVLNLCRNAYEVLQIEKVPGKYLIDC